MKNIILFVMLAVAALSSYALTVESEEAIRNVYTTEYNSYTVYQNLAIKHQMPVFYSFSREKMRNIDRLRYFAVSQGVILPAVNETTPTTLPGDPVASVDFVINIETDAVASYDQLLTTATGDFMVEQFLSRLNAGIRLRQIPLLNRYKAAIVNNGGSFPTVGAWFRYSGRYYADDRYDDDRYYGRDYDDDRYDDDRYDDDREYRRKRRRG